MKLYIVPEKAIQDHSYADGTVDTAFLEANATEIVNGENDCVTLTTRLITLINSGDSDDVFCYLTDGTEIYHS